MSGPESGGCMTYREKMKTMITDHNMSTTSSKERIYHHQLSLGPVSQKADNQSLHKNVDLESQIQRMIS